MSISGVRTAYDVNEKNMLGDYLRARRDPTATRHCRDLTALDIWTNSPDPSRTLG
jgi:hypothetical protein